MWIHPQKSYCSIPLGHRARIGLRCAPTASATCQQIVSTTPLPRCETCHVEIHRLASRQWRNWRVKHNRRSAVVSKKKQVLRQQTESLFEGLGAVRGSSDDGWHPALQDPVSLSTVDSWWQQEPRLPRAGPAVEAAMAPMQPWQLQAWHVSLPAGLKDGLDG